MTEIKICVVCHTTETDMVFDEFAGGYVCKVCDTEREIGVLEK